MWPIAATRQASRGRCGEQGRRVLVRQPRREDRVEQRGQPRVRRACCTATGRISVVRGDDGVTGSWPSEPRCLGRLKRSAAGRHGGESIVQAGDRQHIEGTFDDDRGRTEGHLAALLGEAEEQLTLREDRGVRAVQVLRDPAFEPRRAAADEADHVSAGVADAEYDAVAESVDEGPSSSRDGQPGAEDLGVGEPCVTELPQECGPAWRCVADRPVGTAATPARLRRCR